MVLVLGGIVLVNVLAVAFLLVSLFMMLVILIQKPRGGGLSGAFGGGGGSAQSAFGSKTGDWLTGFTVALFVCFILLAMGMQWAIHNSDLKPKPAAVTPVDEPAGALPPVQTDTAPETDAAQPEAPPAETTNP